MTDKQTHDDGIYRASMASRGKNTAPLIGAQSISGSGFQSKTEYCNSPDSVAIVYDFPSFLASRPTNILIQVVDSTC